MEEIGFVRSKVQKFLIILLICLFAPYKLEAKPISSKPIGVILNKWTSQMVLAKITGSLFEKAGFNVEYINIPADEQWGILARGVAHVQVEVWEGTSSDRFAHMVSLGKVVDAGTHDAITREEWWYPDYVGEMCPGLPDWKALRDCYSLFAIPEVSPRGIYVGGNWEKPDMARIRALYMNFSVERVDSSAELMDKLHEAVKNKKPIVLFNWTPNWVETIYPGSFVEFPDYDPECETDPSWGVNPDNVYDCGNPKKGWLKKVAWSGMEDQWPDAFEVLKKINFDNKMLSTLSFWVDVEGMSIELAAKRWINENKTLWSGWFPDAENSL